MAIPESSTTLYVYVNWRQRIPALRLPRAHLHLLWYAGELRREPDALGVMRFAPGADED